MTQPRPHSDAGHADNLGLVTLLLVVGLVLAWFTLKYGWFGIDPIPLKADTSTR